MRSPKPSSTSSPIAARANRSARDERAGAPQTPALRHRPQIVTQRDGSQLQVVADQASVEEARPATRGVGDGAPPPLMTAVEVAEMLRVPRSTVYELARNRRIPFLKVGRRTLFAQQSLLDWIAAQTVQPRR